MEPGEALSAAAQVAATLAGFAGVVVVFRKGSIHDWSPLDKARLRLLLGNSLLPLAYCLVAILLLSIKPAPLWLWRGASGFALACIIQLVVMTSRRGFVRPPITITGRSKLVFYPFFVLGVASTLAQVYNIAVLNAFWPFYAAIVFHLLAAMVQFVRIIILPAEGES